jgi:quaternary ammonium compound-resistance protein SugE
MAWVLLALAGVLEVGFAVALSFSEGFRRPLPTALFLLFGAGSLVLLNFAVRDLPIGTAYAVWTGIGAAGTALVGVVALGESGSPVRLACIALIVVAVVGLQLSSGGHA